MKRSFWIPSLMILALTSLIIGVSPAQAQTKAPTPAASRDADKVDVSDLEKKYWSAKDTDFSVVQNRMFTKTGRFSLSAEYGTVINDPWSDDPTFNFDLNYYFSERYGMQFEFSKTDARDNDATRQLMKDQGGIPDHNRMDTYYGLGFNWVPFYAKVSVLNSSIIYFDMSVTPGIGLTKYEQVVEAGNVDKTAPTLSLDVTQHYFLNKYLALRLDFKNRWYKQETVAYRGTARSDSGINYMSILGLGLTLYY